MVFMLKARISWHAEEDATLSSVKYDREREFNFYRSVDMWLSQVELLNREGFDFCPKTCPSAAP